VEQEVGGSSPPNCTSLAEASRWVDEAAFDVHAALPSTIAFVERASRLIDHPFDVTRAKIMAR
jgi:hypothetical protein